jgi:hypothetical protein
MKIVKKGTKEEKENDKKNFKLPSWIWNLFYNLLFDGYIKWDR